MIWQGAWSRCNRHRTCGERQLRIDLLPLCQAQLKLHRIVNQHVLPGERLGGNQPRQPEPHARHSQHGRPQLGLGRSKRAQRRIGAQQGPGSRPVDQALFVRTPVIQGNRHVVQHRPGTGVVEVDQPGQVRAFEHRVVAEQVGVDIRPWQRQNFLFSLSDFVQRPLQQIALLGVQVREQLRALLQHPVQTTIRLALDHVGLGRQVQMAEQLAHL